MSSDFLTLANELFGMRERRDKVAYDLTSDHESFEHWDQAAAQAEYDDLVARIKAAEDTLASASPARFEELDNQLILTKASAAGAGSMLLDVQKDYINEKKRADALQAELDMRGPRPPMIGVAAIIANATRKILVSERRGGKMQGWWGAPGGHLEWMETIEERACAELWEEAGMTAEPRDCRIVGVDQDFALEEDHCWIVIFVLMERWRGIPQNMEKDKHGPWEWRALGELPDKTLRPLVRITKKLHEEGRL